MNKSEFLEGINMLQDNYQKTFSKSQLKLFFDNLKDLSKEKFIDNVKHNINTKKFMPTIAQLRNEKNFNNINLNSSFWYKNLREFCERGKIPYYDISKGQDCVLQPYKESDNR